MEHFSFSQIIRNLIRTVFLRNALIATSLLLAAFPLLFYFIAIAPIEKLISNTIEESAAVTAKQLASMINPQQQQFTKDLLQDPLKAGTLEKLKNSLKLERIKIYSSMGEILYSSNPEELGEINDNEYFVKTVAKGIPYTKTVEEKRETAEGRLVNVEIVETYVPLMLENQFLGAFEIYYNITDSHQNFQKIATSFTQLWISLSFLLLSSLCIIFYRSSKDLLLQEKVEKEKIELQNKFKQEQSNKMEALGTLAGGIAHDFNNILAIMTGYTELALSMLDESSEIRDELQEILVAGARARDLIQQILTFCHQSNEEKKTVQIRNVIAEIKKYLNLSLGPNITFETDLQSDSWVLLDPARIHQVLMNLFTNSIQAIGSKPGIIAIKLTDVELDINFTRPYSNIQPGPFVQLTVSDTGCGISPEIIGQIFNPFFTTKKRGEGTGMGLSVVIGIIKSHGGIITVYSESGRGTTFHIYLPVTDSESSIEVPQANSCLSLGEERILYIDDEEPLAKVSQKLLKSLGYDVEIKTNSMEALELIKSDPEKFDLIISDITMPIMPGDELAKEILSLRPDLPIILCTGFSVRTGKEIANELGIKAFVTKPILKESIAKIIRTVLDESKKTKKVQTK